MTEQKKGSFQSKQLLQQSLADMQAQIDTGQVRLNRQQRRAFASLQRKQPDIRKAGIPSRIEEEFLYPVSALLESEGDFGLYVSELPKYETAQQMSRRMLAFYNVLRQQGVQDQLCRTALLSEDKSNNTIPAFCLPPRAAQLVLRVGSAIFGGKSPELTIDYLDEDDEELRKTLIDTSIPTGDILREGIRARAETIALMKMQIAWLREHPVKPQEEIALPEEQSEEIPAISKTAGYNLAGWQVFWTGVPWSVDPNHLTSIPTSSRIEATQALERIGRHDISVKPGSIVRLLEFHLEKDALARAMASRLRYVPDDIKDWVRLKRGKDRIPILIPEQRKVIFFVGGRDEIYRALERH